MNYQRKRDPAQIDAAAEQRRRENAAPRLCQEAPSLVSLRLTFEDLRRDDATGGVAYAKPIVVATAPAYFDVRCMEPRCDGRHDLTAPILNALRAQLKTSSGRNPCNGVVGGGAMCDRTLAYGYEATFRS
jgi:hypothetical protein